jgi:uncharacterized protein (DUF58 family)
MRPQVYPQLLLRSTWGSGFFQGIRPVPGEPSRVLRRVMRFFVVASGWFPLSGLGLLCLLMVGGALRWIALAQQDLVLLSLCCGYLVLHAALLLLVLLRTALLGWHLRTAPAARPHGAEAGRAYHLPAPAPLWRWFPFVQVSWEWLEPDARVETSRKDGREHETVILARRGHYGRIVRRWTVTDCLGLNRIRFSRTQSGEFQVIPGTGRLSEQPLLVRWSNGDEVSDPRGDPNGDRIDMRQYSRGDSPRTILWKVFARSRRLMVRVPERAVAARPKVCAYMVTGPRDEAAAAVCRVMLEGQMLGPEWRFGADGAAGNDHHKEAALERICRSAQSRRPQPQQLAEYLHKAQQDGYGQAVVVLPLDLAGDDVAVRDVLLRSGVPVNVCVAIDGDGKLRRPGWHSWLLQPTENQGLQEQLARAARLWQGFGGSISLVDRRNGALLGDLKSLAPRVSA